MPSAVTPTPGPAANAGPEQEPRLLRAILEQPADDGPRLRYADWLDDHNTLDNCYAARAEFIRLQVQVARGEGGAEPRPPDGDDPDAWDDVVLLLQLYGDLWFPDRGLLHPVIRRGFYQLVRCTRAAFREAAADLFSRQPVTAVRFTDCSPVRLASGGWGWAAGVVPEELLAGLPPAAGFDTEDAAHEALSRAAVAFGRRLAGLPPL